MSGRVVARDFGFSPATVVVQVGQQTSVVLENEDKVTHSFDSGLGGSVDVPAGTTRRIDLTLMHVPEQLTSTFTCRFHGFEGMKGTIRIVP
jgi:plastocyanin